jgi:hypothetical protein
MATETRPGGSLSAPGLDIDESLFRAILAQLIDSNALACRAVLSISSVRFTEGVPTLAVTLTRSVELLVNLAFVRRHCRTEEHVEALIMHEFLHVLLGHTERFKRMDHALNVALDAVINSIIHRSFGKSHSDFMSGYYADEKGIGRILRPMTKDEVGTVCGFTMWNVRPQGMSVEEHEFMNCWDDVYRGSLCADDILDLVDSLTGGSAARKLDGIPVLGNHDPRPLDVAPELDQAVERTMREMNGHGIWRSPRSRGIGHDPYQARFTARDEPMELWRRTAWSAMRRVLLPDRAGAPRGARHVDVLLPILSPRDRRGFVRSLWSPLIPDIRWDHTVPADRASVNLYLDVSGSMNAEMQSIVALLGHFRRWISTPFWAFSNEVAPARIVDGCLQTKTTGGTSMNAVLRHIARTRPRRALVVTDGYIERCDADALRNASFCSIHALVSRDGSTNLLSQARIPCTQLDRFPAPGQAGGGGGVARPGARRPHLP